MWNNLLIFLLLIFLVILQINVLPPQTNFILLFLFFLAVYFPWSRALFWTLLGVFLLSTFYYISFPILLISYTLPLLIISLLKEKLILRQPILMVFSVTVFSLLNGLLLWSLFSLKIIFWQTILNTIVTSIIMLLFYLLKKQIIIKNV